MLNTNIFPSCASEKFLWFLLQCWQDTVIGNRSTGRNGRVKVAFKMERFVVVLVSMLMVNATEPSQEDITVVSLLLNHKEFTAIWFLPVTIPSQLTHAIHGSRQMYVIEIKIKTRIKLNIFNRFPVTVTLGDKKIRPHYSRQFIYEVREKV